MKISNKFISRSGSNICSILLTLFINGGGGVRSFFLKSKFFQLVLEEGGRYFMLQIFERGKFFMRSVFLGKNAAHWLMSNIEHIVVGVSPK